MAILGQSRERESTTEAADRYKQMKQRGREWEVVIHRRLVFFFFSQSVFSTSSKNNTKSAQQWLRRRNGSSPNPRQCWATCKASCVTWNQKHQDKQEYQIHYIQHDVNLPPVTDTVTIQGQFVRGSLSFLLHSLHYRLYLRLISAKQR